MLGKVNIEQSETSATGAFAHPRSPRLNIRNSSCPVIHVSIVVTKIAGRSVRTRSGVCINIEVLKFLRALNSNFTTLRS